MGKGVEKMQKKKKGRPSLLDLQKRSLKEHQNNHHHQNQPKQPATAPISTPARRSTRRNPSPETLSPEGAGEDPDVEDADELSGNRRREKNLNLVLRVPTHKSSSLNSCGSDSEENFVLNQRKRKINAIGDGSGVGNSEKGEKSTSGTNTRNNNPGTQLDLGPSTPVPDKKLLLFILDRLQKKDTYSVFSEPVDPKELPDYHEVIEHPMDFSTVRKKLASGAYGNLEQFEKDVFLICSNAMEYNSPDTVFFRQARSIQELAKKSFENLREDSDNNEPEPKIVRRGRPPTKNLKKPLSRPSLERAGSEFSSDATLASGGENTTLSNHVMRKGPLLEKSGFADSSGRFFHGSRNDFYIGLAENKYERNDEFTDSMLKSNSIRHGKKQFGPGETKRKTYRQSHQSVGGQEPSVLTTFDRERKQLIAVGLHSEYGYARSLARFAVSLGPVAWGIASNKIGSSLPPGVKFGPGWIGENDMTPQRLVPPSPPQDHLSPLQPSSVTGNLSSAVTPCTAEPKEARSPEKPEPDNLSDKHEPSTRTALNGHLRMPPSAASPSSSMFPPNQSSEPSTEKAEVRGLSSHNGFNVPTSSTDVNWPRPPFQILQDRIIHPGMNGFKGAYGLNLPVQTGNLIGAARPAGFNFHSSQTLDSRTNTNFVHPASANKLNSEDSDNSSKINMVSPHPYSGSQVLLSRQQIPDSGLSQQQKRDSVPPDLNLRFQAPGYRSSSQVDSTQPDLALQL